MPIGQGAYQGGIMKKLLKNKKGQSSVEYILIIAMVVGAIFMFGGKFKEKLGSATDGLFDGVNKNISGLTGGK